MLISSALVLGATLAAPAALADPVAPSTASEAAQRVSELGRDLEILQEQQNEAQVRMDGFVTQASTARAQLAEADAVVGSLADQVQSIARSAFGGDRLGSLSAMLTSGSPGEFLDRVSTLETLARRNGDLITEADRARQQVLATTQRADAAVVSGQATLADIAAREEQISGQIADFQALYDQLSAAERESLTPQEEAAPEAENPEAETTGGVPPGPVLAPTEAARVAVEAAYAQLGDSYSWGAAGPDSFDCSGLTMFVYAQAGVSLPHSSRAQSGLGVPVSRAELAPGDLVFYYSPVSHVGIYVGNGQIIHASTYGTPVRLAPVEGSYNSARRIVG